MRVKKTDKDKCFIIIFQICVYVFFRFKFCNQEDQSLCGEDPSWAVAVLQSGQSGLQERLGPCQRLCGGTFTHSNIRSSVVRTYIFYTVFFHGTLCTNPLPHCLYESECYLEFSALYFVLKCQATFRLPTLTPKLIQNHFKLM